MSKHAGHVKGIEPDSRGHKLLYLMYETFDERRLDGVEDPQWISSGELFKRTEMHWNGRDDCYAAAYRIFNEKDGYVVRRERLSGNGYEYSLTPQGLAYFEKFGVPRLDE